MGRISNLLFGVVLIIMMTNSANAVVVTPDEQMTAHQWVTGKFGCLLNTVQPNPGLEIVSNYDAIQRNNRFGHPLQIGGVKYAHGLFCHAPSRIVVRLPGPGKTFKSSIGLDSHSGGGSVVFSVKVNDKSAFQSEVIKQGMDPMPVNVDLAGSTQFTIEVDSTSDGISCDQANWADAKVVLANGKSIWQIGRAHV